MRHLRHVVLTLFLFCIPDIVFAVGTVSWQEGFPVRMGNQNLLFWQVYPGAIRYSIKRVDLADSKVQEFHSTVNQWIDAEVPRGKSYSYIVSAVDQDSRPIAESSVATMKSDLPPPPPVPEVAYRSSDGTVFLSWKPSPEALFYNIYRKVGQNWPTSEGSVVATRFVDSGLPGDEKAIYNISAVNSSSLESGYSEPIVINVAPQKTPDKQVVKRFPVTMSNKLKTRAGYALVEPTDFAVTDNAMVISNSGAKTVLVLNRDGELQRSLSAADYPNGPKWGVPWGLDIAADSSKVAVAFMNTPYVRVFDPQVGKSLLVIQLMPPMEIKNATKIPQPLDVVFDRDGNLWVSDATYQQIIKFSPTGEELLRVGVPKYGDLPPTFKSINFLAYDRKNSQISASDSLSARIYTVAADGKNLLSWKNFSAKIGPVNLPKGILARVNGNLMVVDGILGTLQEFNSSGAIQAIYTDVEKTRLPVKGLLMVAVDEQARRLYLLSKLESTIYQFDIPEKPIPVLPKKL